VEAKQLRQGAPAHSQPPASQCSQPRWGGFGSISSGSLGSRKVRETPTPVSQPTTTSISIQPGSFLLLRRRTDTLMASLSPPWPLPHLLPPKIAQSHHVARAAPHWLQIPLKSNPHPAPSRMAPPPATAGLGTGQALPDGQSSFTVTDRKHKSPNNETDAGNRIRHSANWFASEQGCCRDNSHQPWFPNQ
jgi:hypothetical protein